MILTFSDKMENAEAEINVKFKSQTHFLISVFPFRAMLAFLASKLQKVVKRAHKMVSQNIQTAYKKMQNFMPSSNLVLDESKGPRMVHICTYTRTVTTLLAVRQGFSNNYYFCRRTNFSTTKFHNYM
jgi:hypothetical protein